MAGTRRASTLRGDNAVRGLAFILSLLGGLLGIAVGVYFVVVGEDADYMHFYSSSFITVLGISNILAGVLGIAVGLLFRSGMGKVPSVIGFVAAAVWSLFSAGVFSAVLFLLAAIAALFAGSRTAARVG